MDPEFLLMEWQNGFEATLDGRVVLTDTYIPMTPVPAGNFGRLVLEDTSKENFEIIRYNRKDAGGVYVETASGGRRNEDGTSTGIHPRGARVRGNITKQDIVELRKAAKDVQDGYMAMTAGSDWRSIPITPTMVSSDGQRQHKLRYTGADYSGTIPTGAKLKIPRTGTTPTTSMAFVAASSQYASKTSPTGLTFADDFTVEAQVYPESYISQIIVGRMNAAATSGWNLQITNEGRIQIVGVGTSGVSRLAISYQSVPLNKWTHVAATLDMSAGTATIYIDGVSVPLSVTGTGTSLIQAGELSVGRYDGGAYFNGKIANARVWSTIRTAAEIRDNMNHETPASTTGLVAHFKGNGSWNDSSSNANHLTAVGGAVNNFASHPYSATEYAIATKVEYTGGNTDVTVFTGSNCLPNETLGATSYSTARAPYGFPADRKKWAVSTIFLSRVELTVAPSANNSLYTYQGDCARLTIPTGAWNAGYNVAIWATRTTGGALAFSLDLANNSTTSDPKSTLSSVLYSYDPTATSRELAVTMTKEAGVSLTTSTVHYLNFRSRTAGMASAPLFADYQECRIYAECAYL